MSLLNFLASPDGVTLIGLVLGALGLKRQAAKRAATNAEIDRWASTAFGAVALAIKAGVITDDTRAVSVGLEKLRTIAAAAGVEVSAEHEARALAIGHEAIVAAGQAALGDALKQLERAADAALKRMNAAPAPR